MTTLRNISLHQKNNGKLSPLSLIPYTPYTNLRPSFYEEQTIKAFRKYAVSVSNRCDIGMIATNVTHIDAYINIIIIAATQKKTIRAIF